MYMKGVKIILILIKIKIILLNINIFSMIYYNYNSIINLMIYFMGEFSYSS